MDSPVLWIGGWASGLAAWRPWLETLYPGCAHRFLDSHDVLEDFDLLPRALEEMPTQGTVIAWSMGSLLVHRGLADGMVVPKCRLISASPIFDFCGINSPWPKAAVKRMARRVRTERESVLGEFWTGLKAQSLVSQDIEAAWYFQTRAYSMATLVLGLELLAQASVDRAAMPDNPRHFFLSSPLDPLVPFQKSSMILPKMENKEADPMSRAWIEYPRGHLPFLDFPELFRPILDGSKELAPL